MALSGTGLLAAGCAEEPAPNLDASAAGAVLVAAAGTQVEGSGLRVPGSHYGSYLAGLYAGHQRDLSAAADFLLESLSYDPDNAQLLNRAFMLVASDGRYAESVGLAKRIQAVEPGQGVVALVLAVDAIERGALDEADSYFEKAPERGLDTVIAPLMRGWLRVARGDLEGGLKSISVLKNRSGFGVFHGLHAALMHQVAGQTDAAAAAYEETLKLAEQPSLGLVLIAGTFFERAGRPDRATEIYRDFEKRNPDSTLIASALERIAAGQRPAALIATARDGMAEVLFNVASLLSQERAEEVALINVHQALRLKPDFVIARVLLGEILQGQDRSKDAIAAYRKVPADSLFSWMVRLRIAEELERLDKVPEAIAELEALAATRPDRFEPLYRLGNLLRAKERFAEAVDAYDRAAKRIGKPEKRHWTLYYFRGICLERLSKWPRAERDFLLALNLEPEQPLVMNYLAYTWLEKREHLDRAKGMLVRAVELRPDDGFIVDSLGWAYFSMGEFKEGVKYLERAVELRPQDPVINDHLGDAYWRVGRHEEARFQWRRALSLGPEEDAVSVIETKIERGLADPAKDI